MEQSSAELRDVTLTSPGVAVMLKRSRIKWTGGRIEGETRGAGVRDIQTAGRDIRMGPCHQPAAFRTTPVTLGTG